MPGVVEDYLAQFGIVDEVGAVSVDESTEGQAILPAGQTEPGCQALVHPEALSYPHLGSAPSRAASSIKRSEGQPP